MKKQFRQIGQNVTMPDSVLVPNPHLVSIGNDVNINERAELFAQNANEVHQAGSIQIGNNCMISKGTVIFAGRGTIKISDHCEIGLHCTVIAQRRSRSRKTTGAEGVEVYTTEIGEECLIGARAIILEGTKLGKRCVVAAGAVVQGEYPDDVTLIGNPARAVPNRNSIS
ncbi:MAG: acyltransferase [Bacteroidetes bacterium]|nr:acyltransferase [Bacteroidota bacterium]